MSDAPLITIGILCYNAEDTIERAIRSAQAQDWVHKEIIIVDDVSQDRSVDFIEDLIAEMPQTRLVRHESNQGAPGARNTVIKEAQGEFIAFFDDDDESLPERLTVQYERITSYEQQMGSSLIACYVSGERLYPNNYRYPLDAIGSKEPIPKGPRVADRLLYFGGPKTWFFGSGTPTCSMMARKSTFESIGGFDPNFRRQEDIDLAIRLAQKGAHFIGCQGRLLVQHATISADKSQERDLESSLHLVEKHQDYLKKQGMYRYAKTWPYIRYYNFTKQYAKMVKTLLYLSIFYPVRVLMHLWRTGPARLRHERKMQS